MPLRMDLIGQKSEPVSFRYAEDDVILYALGIGAELYDELNFLYEKNLKVFPTFAVVPLTVEGWDYPARIGMNMFTVLHGEQKIELYGPIPTKGTLSSVRILDAIYDKGDAGAVAYTRVETRDEGGKLLFMNRSVIFDRSAGNFGGERGPKAEKNVPPEGKAPDFRVEYPTSSSQAALYRLSGDKNPLHIEPEFARMGGLDRPILHGLCTFGFAGRAILHSLCQGEPERFKSFSVRFTGVVFPGETLVTEGWETAPGTYVIQTKTGDGRLVLGNAKAEIA
jgi:acyl dehydratase